MNILDKIIATKTHEVEQQKMLVSQADLEKMPYFSRHCNSLNFKLQEPQTSGIIAEFKQKSPSKGIINATANVQEVTLGYANAGAVALSVLTDNAYFGGNAENLISARMANPAIPILRKDFMIDPYQIYEAKAWGADLILLIAACLSFNQAERLAKTAKMLGMEVLMEVHETNELAVVNNFVDIVGVNNRNLKTFETDIETSVRVGKLIPSRFTKISESGLSGVKEIRYLRQNGFKGFLIGETFMKTENPAEACKIFIEKLKI